MTPRPAPLTGGPGRGSLRPPPRVRDMGYISRIYTRSGDEGQTSLGDGTRVEKDHPRVAAYGAVDEVNAVLGMLLASVPDAGEAELLSSIQNDLFDVGADLCVPPGKDEEAGARLRITA